MKNPIIVVGMHRSGTTLLTSLLIKAGVYMGKERDPNEESYEFLFLNDWLLSRAASTWNNPWAFLASEYLDGVLIKGLEKIFKRATDSFFKHSTTPWGWKDPRNSITLRIWLKVFPDAKIIHVYRNPLDVALSLKKRAEKEIKKHERDFLRSLSRRSAMPISWKNAVSRPTMAQFAGVIDIEYGLKLWLSYESEILKRTKGKKVMNIKYENFLNEPQKTLSEVLSFVGISPQISQEVLKDFQIKRGRANAFKKENSLLELYKELFKRPSFFKILKELGYESV